MSRPAHGYRREFAFDKADFDDLRGLIKRTTGINIAECRESLVYGRIVRRLRQLGLPSFAEYRRLLQSDSEAELLEFCNAMTTNLTAFFREPHHFDFLREQILRPRSMDPRAPRRVRIWSAACSSGEEPYSLAMTVCEAIPDWRRWDIKILATDIDSGMLAAAWRGVYAAERLGGMSERRLRDFFVSHRGEACASYGIAPHIAGLVSFKRLNLVDALPMHGPLDAIFCRNVVIYFDKDTQRDVFERLAPLQRRGDHLFLGHSETLFRLSERYELLGRTIYRRR